jgi:hypothetical protein
VSFGMLFCCQNVPQSVQHGPKMNKNTQQINGKRLPKTWVDLLSFIEGESDHGILGIISFT